MKLNPNIAISENGYVFVPSTGDSYALNPIGRTILELLREGKTTYEIQVILEDQYEVPSELLERDMEDYISHLRQLKLLYEE